MAFEGGNKYCSLFGVIYYPSEAEYSHFLLDKLAFRSFQVRNSAF